MLEDDDDFPDGEEFDAVGRFGEPEEAGGDDLAPSIPGAPDTPGAESVDPELRTRFWGLVLLFNVALLAVSIGAMLVIFGVDSTLGVQVLAVGLVLTGFGIYRYRKARAAVQDVAGDGDDDHDD